MAGVPPPPPAGPKLGRAPSSVIGSLLEEVGCPICLTTPAVTPVALPCGHLLCQACWEEWASRKAECPQCRHPAPLAAAVHIPAIDSLVTKIADLRSVLDATRMDALLPGGGAGGEGRAASGVDAVYALFRDALSASLHESSRYMLELEACRDETVRAADAVCHGVKAGGGSVEAVTAAAMARDGAVAAATRQYEAARDALLADVRSYLSTLPSLNVLPSTVVVSVPAARVRCEVRMRPLDTVAAVVIPAVLRAVGGAPSPSGADLLADATWTAQPSTHAPGVGAGATHHAIPVDPDAPLFRQLPGGRPTVGMVLTASGGSAAGSRCCVDSWLPGSKHDYCMCRTCGLKWICAACADTCHRSQGHDITPFLAGHVPTFACCYCRSRGGKCRVPAGRTPAPAPPPPVTPPDLYRTD